MPIPTFDSLMLPVLRHCEKKGWIMRDLITRIADDLGLSQEERELRIPSGTATIIANRVGWVKTYLKQAGLLTQPKRAFVEITQRGRDVLSKNPEKIDVALLEHFEEFRAFQNSTKHSGGAATGTVGVSPRAVQHARGADRRGVLDPRRGAARRAPSQDTRGIARVL
jgi:restriction system protein